MRGYAKANLSLKCWPKKQISMQDYHLSPLTVKILKDNETRIDDLLPISFQAFSAKVHKNYSKEIARIVFNQTNSKRLKKVQQLRAIYYRIKEQSKQKKKSQLKKRLQPSIYVCSPISSKRNTSTPKRLLKSQRYSKTSNFSACQYLKNSKQHSSSKDSKRMTHKKKKVFEEDSTKSNKYLKQSAEYYAIVSHGKKSRNTCLATGMRSSKRQTHKSKGKNKVSLSQKKIEKLVKKISRLLQQYMAMDSEQKTEIQRFRVEQSEDEKGQNETEVETEKFLRKELISKAEKKRLQKIHHIEKEHIKIQLEDNRILLGKLVRKQDMQEGHNSIHNIFKGQRNQMVLVEYQGEHQL